MAAEDCELAELARSHYLWDNWIAYDGERGLFYRYLLAASRELSIGERHAAARIRCAVSEGGQTWRDRGEILAPGPAGAFDDLAVWTGATVIDSGRFLLHYTGVAAEPRLAQSIGLARSEDGVHFEKTGSPVLAPDPARAAELGYDVGESDGLIPAWRDPQIARDPRSGAWHMVFAAKRAADAPRGTVGHAVAAAGDLARWELRPPLTLPERTAQMEVPALVFSGGRVFCTVSTKDADREESEAAGAAWRVYEAPEVEGPWAPAASGPVLTSRDRIYGVRPFWGPRGLAAAGFYAPDHPERPLSPTPIAPLDLPPTANARLSARLVGGIV